MSRTDRMPRIEWPLRPGDYAVTCKNGHQSNVRVDASSDAYLVAIGARPGPSTSEKVYRRCPVCGVKATFNRIATP